MKNIVYFDLETRRSASEVGGWHETAKMGMSVGVTFSTADQAYSIYTEDRAADLINQLQQADLVVGYNHINFDYGVLQPFTFWTVSEMTHNLDICLYLSERLGHRLRLDAVARPTLGGCTKTAEGTDVKVTMAVHQFGVKNGYVLYIDKNSKETKIDVDWMDDWEG